MSQANEKPYGQMLLDGIMATRDHIIEWGHREGVPDDEALASGWIAGLLAENHATLAADPARLMMMDQLGPTLIAALREAREQREASDEAWAAVSDG